MNLVSKLLKHDLIGGSLFMFIGSMVANVMAFLLNLFFARTLTYADYAIFASLLSVITLAAIPAGSLNTIIVKFATDYFANKEFGKLKSLYFLFFKLIFGISIFIVASFMVFSIPFAKFLRLDSIWYVIATGLSIASFYILALHNAFLQSLLKFGFISFMSGFGGVLKLIFGVGFLLLGFRAYSGIWGIFFMGLGMFLLAFFPLKEIIFAKRTDVKISLGVKSILLYAIPTFVTVLFMTSFTSVDVILAKHFFTPSDAGFYAGLSLVGKVIFYFTIPIPIVMFPLIVKRHATGKGIINIFLLALILVTVPSVLITAVYLFFPKFVITLFLGGRDYLSIAPYLGYFGIFLTIFSIVNLFVNFYLSLGRIKIVFPVTIAALMQIVLIYLFHKTFSEIITVSLIVTVSLLLMFLGLFIKHYGSSVKIKETINLLNTPTV